MNETGLLLKVPHALSRMGGSIPCHMLARQRGHPEYCYPQIEGANLVFLYTLPQVYKWIGCGEALYCPDECGHSRDYGLWPSMPEVDPIEIMGGVIPTWQVELHSLRAVLNHAQTQPTFPQQHKLSFRGSKPRPLLSRCTYAIRLLRIAPKGSLLPTRSDLFGFEWLPTTHRDPFNNRKDYVWCPACDRVFFFSFLFFPPLPFRRGSDSAFCFFLPGLPRRRLEARVPGDLFCFPLAMGTWGAAGLEAWTRDAEARKGTWGVRVARGVGGGRTACCAC